MVAYHRCSNNKHGGATFFMALVVRNVLACEQLVIPGQSRYLTLLSIAILHLFIADLDIVIIFVIRRTFIIITIDVVNCEHCVSTRSRTTSVTAMTVRMNLQQVWWCLTILRCVLRIIHTVVILFVFVFHDSAFMFASFPFGYGETN